MSDDDLGAAALHLLDWLGCALAGAATETGRRIALAGQGGHPMALAGSGGAEAAAAMGGLGSLLEMDDVHRAALLHPGPVVCAAAMALPPPATGAALLGAILAGYEAMIRLGAAVGPGHYALFHNTGTCGGIGSAVAAARLSGLDPAATVWAMGHAVSLSAGLWQCRNEPGETKHLHVAEAARRGLRAAQAAAAGLAGPRFVLEGPQGFFAALAPGGAPDAVLADPAAPWQLHATSFKPWPACRHAHPAIDAALALRPALSGPARHIRIETYADAVLFCDRPQPRTSAEARFSLQHAVAVALADGPPALAAFADDALARPAYADLRARAEVARDPGFTARYPAHFGARVAVTDAAGRTHTAEIADAWGDSENPMPPEAVVAKFRALAAAAGVPDAAARRIEAATLALAQGGAPAALIAALRALT
jgi:2-methylcitrate dehydratase PrpD